MRKLLFIAACALTFQLGQSFDETVLTPSEMQAKMGLGINLGNRLDLYDQPNRTVRESFFDQFKAKNFTNVRIPVCWDLHTMQNSPYTIDEDFLNLVETIVNHSLERGFVTILNTHHEKWLDDPSVFEKKLPRLESIWRQISTRFSPKNQILLFEIFNEPHLMTIDQLNEMNARILPIIRESNPTRIVLLMGLRFGNPSWILQNPDALTIPSDPQIALEIHNYDPFDYAGSNPTVHSWGSSDDRSALSSWVSDIQAWSISKKIPLYYGEFGCTNAQNSSTGKDDWFLAHADAIRANGWGASVWNDGGGHLIFDYETEVWDSGILRDLGMG